MVAPSLRALGTVTSTSTTTPTFAAPAGAASTDVILVLWFQDDGRNSVTGVPTGFTVLTDMPQINDPAAGAPSHSLRGYWGRFSAVGAGPYAFTITPGAGGTPFCEGRTSAIQDCITTGDPFEAADGNTSGATSVTTAPSVSATSTGPDRYAIYAATNWASGAWTPPSGFTEQWDANTRIVTFDDETLATAQTVTPQAVCAGSSRSNAWVGILLPVASATTINGTATIAGAGAVTAAATQRATAALAGSGAVVASAVQRATSTMAGAGAVTAAATLRAGATAAGAGAVTASTVQAATATIVGNGTLTANAGGTVTGTATISGAGSVTATAVQQSRVTAAGAGSVTATAVVAGAATITGTGAVTALVQQQARAAIVGAGSVSITADSGSKTTPRPSAGTTSRPGSGTTSRPFAGITVRP